MKTTFSLHNSRLALVAGLLALTYSEARADDYSRYGIRYDFISDTEAEVSGTDDRQVYDLYWLADDISVNGKTYRVVGIADGVFREKTVTGWKSSTQLKYIGADAFRDAKLKWGMNGTELPYIKVQAGEIRAGAFAGFTAADGGWLDIRLGSNVERIGALAFASDAINCIDCTELDDADKMPTTDGELCEEHHYSQIEIRCYDWTEKWQGADTWKKFHTFYYYANHQRNEQGLDFVLDDVARTASLRSGFSYHARSVTAEDVFSIGQKFTFRYDYAVTDIGSYALGSSTMTSLQLPSTIRQIGEGAFAYCPKLTEVVVLASEPPAMPEQAFAADVLSTAILRVPEASLQQYRQAEGWKHFANVEAIKNAIADNVVFRDQTASTRLVFIEKLKADYQLPAESDFPIRTDVGGKEKMVLGLDDGVCDNQTALERARFPFGYLQIGTFKKCTSLRAVDVPSTVQELGWGAFEGCTALTDVTLQRGVMRLQNRAFYGCLSLERITLPSTIERICDRAFQGTALTDLTLYATTPPWITQKAFEGRWDEVTLHVPHGTKEAYDTTAYYNLFKQIVEMEAGAAEPAPDFSDMPDVPVTKGTLMLDFSKMNLEDGFADKTVQGVYLNQMSSMGDRYDAEEGCLELHSYFDSMYDASTEVRLHSMYYGPFFFKHLIGGIMFRLPKGKGVLRYDVHGGREVLLTGQLVNEGSYIGASRVRYTSTDELSIGFEKGACCYIFASSWVGDGTRIYNLCWTPEGEEPDIDVMSSNSYTYFDTPFMDYQDLSGCVINNVYYCLDPAVASEIPGSVVISRRQDEAAMDRIVSTTRQVSELTNNDFVGLVMKVPAGRSFISLRAECLGQGALHVRVGQQPVRIIDREDAEKNILVECNVADSSFVYIYCGDKTYASRPMNAPAKTVTVLDDCIRLYSLRWFDEAHASRITTPALQSSGATGYYGLTGIKQQTPRRGFNIVKTADGETRKVISVK